MKKSNIREIITDTSSLKSIKPSSKRTLIAHSILLSLESIFWSRPTKEEIENNIKTEDIFKSITKKMKIDKNFEKFMQQLKEEKGTGHGVADWNTRIDEVISQVNGAIPSQKSSHEINMTIMNIESRIEQDQSSKKNKEYIVISIKEKNSVRKLTLDLLETMKIQEGGIITLAHTKWLSKKNDEFVYERHQLYKIKSIELGKHIYTRNNKVEDHRKKPEIEKLLS